MGDPSSGCWWASESRFWLFLSDPKTANNRCWGDWCMKTRGDSGELIRWVWAARYWGLICPISQFIGYNCPFSYLEVEATLGTCPISEKNIKCENSMGLLSSNGRTMHSFRVAEGYICISIILDCGFLMKTYIGKSRAKKLVWALRAEIG